MYVYIYIYIHISYVRIYIYIYIYTHLSTRVLSRLGRSPIQPRLRRVANIFAPPGEKSNSSISNSNNNSNNNSKNHSHNHNSNHSIIRPVHLLRVSLLRVLESNFPGDSLSNHIVMIIPTSYN